MPDTFTRLIDLTSTHYDLTVWVEADADLDGEFAAICDDTGERLNIHGWMFEVVQ